MFQAKTKDGKTFTAQTLRNIAMQLEDNNQGVDGAKIYHYGALVSVDICQVSVDKDPPPLLLWTRRFPLRAMPAKKCTDAGRFKEEVQKYHAYKNKLAALCKSEGFDRKNWDVYSIKIVALFALPKKCFNSDGSMNAHGHRMAGSPYRSTPDVDNILKTFLDTTVPLNDAGVIHGESEKFYSSSTDDAVIIQIGYRLR